MLRINHSISISDSEYQLTAIRSQGPGGQNVNKVATAIQLRFDIKASSLSDFIKHRLLNSSDHRITKDGTVVIKSQGTRSQEANKEQALARLKELILSATKIQKRRLATKPTKNSQKRRLDSKIKRGQRKSLRRKVNSSSE